MVCLLQICFYRFTYQFNVYLFHRRMSGNRKGLTAVFPESIVTAASLWLILAVSNFHKGFRKILKP